MSGKPTYGSTDRRLLLEAVTAGLAYGAGLCWASVCLFASFRPNSLGHPYWSAIPNLRTDTCGIAAFFVVAICLTGCEYLRLYRGRAGAAASGQAPIGGTTALIVRAVAKTVAVLGTGLVVYLSVNSVTHPVTLDMPATHLVAWPTEGTLRVVAIILCAWAIGVLRYASCSVPCERAH
jgi:hypothetical protein